MKRRGRLKKLLSIVLLLTMVIGILPMTDEKVKAADDPATYTITIPARLTVENSGWNSIGAISVTGSLNEGDKLKVSASSENNWALVSAEDSIAYTMHNGTDSAGEQATSWFFTELSENADTRAIGINVSDYSNKPVGTYEDTVIFTTQMSYTVTFDMNGKTGTNPVPASIEVVEGGKVTRPSDPEAAQSDFKGWYKETACQTPWNFDNDTVQKSTKIYAKWGAESLKTLNITVKFKLDAVTDYDDYGDPIINHLEDTKTYTVEYYKGETWRDADTRDSSSLGFILISDQYDYGECLFIQDDIGGESIQAYVADYSGGVISPDSKVIDFVNTYGNDVKILSCKGSGDLSWDVKLVNSFD